MKHRPAALSADDKLTIQESIFRLSHAYAEGDVAAFVALFDDNAVLEVGWSGLVSTRIAGRSGIEKWLADVSNLYWTVKCSRVWVGNLVTDPTAEGATTIGFFHRIGQDGQSLSTGTWTFRHRKPGERWLISSLRIVVDGTQEEFAAKQALATARARHGRTAS